MDLFYPQLNFHVEVPALQCCQEEADGLHAVHAAREYEAVVICSEDTDVFILCLAFHDRIGKPLFLKCGTKTRRRIVDIRKVAATVGTDVCRALIDMHAYTGCDAVSAFAGKGKVKALKLLTSNKEHQNTFLSWARNGIFLLTLWTNWKHLRVSSMPPKLQ